MIGGEGKARSSCTTQLASPCSLECLSITLSKHIALSLCLPWHSFWSVSSSSFQFLYESTLNCLSFLLRYMILNLQVFLKKFVNDITNPTQWSSVIKQRMSRWDIIIVRQCWFKLYYSQPAMLLTWSYLYFLNFWYCYKFKLKKLEF